MEIILASASPRRKEILTAAGVSIRQIITADIDERCENATLPRHAVEELARRKGAAVAQGHRELLLPILSADTLVDLNGHALGKPQGQQEAYRMLRALSGRTHAVHTGVALHVGGRCFCGVASTLVTFRPLSDEEIYAYIRTGEPFDKAGGYGIQGGAGPFVLHIEGDMDTVIGLSMQLCRRLFLEAGL